MRYFKDLKEHLPLSSEGVFSVCLFIVLMPIVYGLEWGLVVVAEWISVISDGLIIAYTRDLIFWKRYTAETVRGRKIYLPIFIVISLILHPITYHYLGMRSLTLIPPMFVLLIMIYLINKYLTWRNRKNDE